jgi:hypothetical protein
MTGNTIPSTARRGLVAFRARGGSENWLPPASAERPFVSLIERGSFLLLGTNKCIQWIQKIRRIVNLGPYRGAELGAEIAKITDGSIDIPT